MTSNQIIKKVAEKYPDKKQVEAVIKDFLAEMQNCFLQNQRVMVKGLFALMPSFRGRKTVHHTMHNNDIIFEVPDRWIIKCKTMPAFREQLTNTLINSSHDD